MRNPCMIAGLMSAFIIALMCSPGMSRLAPGQSPGPNAAWFRRQVSDYSEMQTSRWLERQRNVNNGSCCSNSDGHMLDDNQFRVVGGPPDSRGDMTGRFHPDPNPDGTGVAYEVNINGHWLPVIYSMIVRQWDADPNPTGKAIVWYSFDSTERTDANPDGVRIWCFAPGTLS